MDVFKAYDICGTYPKEINENFAKRLARALVHTRHPNSCVVGFDARISSPLLHKAFVEELLACGVSVTDIGQTTTPQFYFALYSSYADCGAMITASHNPKQYNGFKLYGPKAKPLYQGNGLDEIQNAFEQDAQPQVTSKGKLLKKDVQQKYSSFFSTFIKPLTSTYHIIADTGNGMAKKELDVFETIMKSVYIERIFEAINGNFPYHECNPVDEKNTAVLQTHLDDGDFDFGVAFDGDADRIVFFLSDGTMVPPDIMTGLLGAYIGRDAHVVGYDARTSQAVIEFFKEYGVQARQYSVGCPFIKKHMQQDKAIFAGDTSGHYMYKTIQYTDSPLLTLLTTLYMLDEMNQTLDELVKPLLNKYVRSPEIDIPFTDTQQLRTVFNAFKAEAQLEDSDGLWAKGPGYFFTLRKSSTRPVLRLRAEAVSQPVLDTLLARIQSLL